MPVSTPLLNLMVLTYNEFKTVYLSSVQKCTHNSHSLRICMFSYNVDLQQKL